MRVIGFFRITFYVIPSWLGILLILAAMGALQAIETGVQMVKDRLARRRERR